MPEQYPTYSTRKNNYRNRIVAAAAACVFSVSGAACGLELPSSAQGQSAQQPSGGEAGPGKHPTTEIIKSLSSLAVKGRAPKTGYSREQFGQGWAESNSCDTRNRILRRDLTDITLDPKDCKILTGTLHDPYTGKTIAFTRGTATSGDVQIDHAVSLSDAWQKGAQQLTAARRVQLANDPLELVAVDGPTNERKGDSDAATWLPPNKDARCDYVARQILVKEKYELWVTQAEHDAMEGVLNGCQGQMLSVPE
jgi:hypothetical protein